MMLLIIHFLQSLIVSSLFGPQNILLSTLLSVNARDTSSFVYFNFQDCRDGMERCILYLSVIPQTLDHY
jgi:hypothetical protein